MGSLDLLMVMMFVLLQLMDQTSSFSKSHSMALLKSHRFRFVHPAMETAFMTTNAVPSSVSLPYTFLPPQELVRAAAAIVPLPWLVVKSHTNL